MEQKNKHHYLDSIKLHLSREVVARFSLPSIRAHAKANLLRWKTQGSWGPTYDEWLRIIDSADDSLLTSYMIGLDENSNRLRQSMPYVNFSIFSSVSKSSTEYALVLTMRVAYV